jgi:hypothetical protein
MILTVENLVIGSLGIGILLPRLTRGRLDEAAYSQSFGNLGSYQLRLLFLRGPSTC